MDYSILKLSCLQDMVSRCHRLILKTLVVYHYCCKVSHATATCLRNKNHVVWRNKEQISEGSNNNVEEGKRLIISENLLFYAL